LQGREREGANTRKRLHFISTTAKAKKKLNKKETNPREIRDTESVTFFRSIRDSQFACLSKIKAKEAFRFVSVGWLNKKKQRLQQNTRVQITKNTRKNVKQSRFLKRPGNAEKPALKRPFEYEFIGTTTATHITSYNNTSRAKEGEKGEQEEKKQQPQQQLQTEV